jgi:hypothetical protein
VEKVRAIPAPRQDDSRVVVLGVVLWPDHITLHAVCESDLKEISEPFWEDDQADMFGITDDLGTRYYGRNASGGGDDQLHVWEWEIGYSPGVPDGASTLTISHIDGSVEISL